SSEMVRARVMPDRKAPLATGVKTWPSLTMKMLDEAVSATLPSMSRTSALSKLRALSSMMARLLLGSRLPALALVGMGSMVGRRKRDTVTEKPDGGSIGATKRHRQKRVVSGSAGTPI